MTRAKKIYYVQFGQLGVVIEDSRWKLLYLVVTQFPKRRYSLISVKSVIFRNFICVVPGSNTRLCYNPGVFDLFFISTNTPSIRRF